MNIHEYFSDIYFYLFKLFYSWNSSTKQFQTINHILHGSVHLQDI